MIYLKSIFVGLAFTFGALYATVLLSGLILGVRARLGGAQEAAFGFHCAPLIYGCRACWSSSLGSSGDIESFQNSLLSTPEKSRYRKLAVPGLHLYGYGVYRG